MEKNATIRLKDSINGETVMMTTGTVSKYGNCWNIIYEDNNGSFAISVSDGIISLSRLGDENYTLIFEKDKEHKFRIQTQFGFLNVWLFPKLVSFLEKDQGLDIGLEYDLRSESGEKQEFKLYMNCTYNQ